MESDRGGQEQHDHYGENDHDGASKTTLSNSEYKLINTKRLERHSWLARHKQELTLDTVVDEDSVGEYEFPGRDPECRVLRETASQLSWYKNSAYDDVERSRLYSSVPSVFIRPSRYRGIGNKTSKTIRSSLSLDSGLSDADAKKQAETDTVCDPLMWVPDIRHTAKSRDMAEYLKVRNCIISQIDFIKQRDNVWSDKRLYKAVAKLRRFMNEHNFKYLFIPDHQRQWLTDMLKRLDQWELLRRPRHIAHLWAWMEKKRRDRLKKELEDKCLRVTNPPFFDWQKKEAARVEKMLADDERLRRKEIYERNRNRMDWVEGRMTRHHQKVRPDQRPKVPPPLPRHIARDPYVFLKRIDRKSGMFLNVPHKPLVEIAKQVGESMRFNNSFAARDPHISKHIHPRKRRVSATPARQSKSEQPLKQPKKPVDDAAVDSQKIVTATVLTSATKDDGKKVISKDLAEVLQLIQSIEVEEKKLKEELRDLKRKKGEMTGIPAPEEDVKKTVPISSTHLAPHGSPSPHRIGCRPVYLPPLPAKEVMQQQHDDSHKLAKVRHEASLESRSKAARYKRQAHASSSRFSSDRQAEEASKSLPKGKQLDVKTRDLLQEVYQGVHAAIDEYVDELVRKEFADRNTPRPKTAQPG